MSEFFNNLGTQSARYLPLSDVAAIGGRSVHPTAMGSDLVNIFSLPSFDQCRVPERLIGTEVGSSKVRLRNPCVLVAKLNPHIPRVWQLASIPPNSYCSPEFYPLEPDPRVLDLGFLDHFIRTKMRGLSGTVTGSTNSHRRLHREDFLGLRIPVPPLEVQREIVRILDQFTQLEAELEAELEARRRQYVHYRSELILQSQNDVKFTLGEIETRGLVKLGRGQVISKVDLANIPGDYPVYSSSGAGTGEFGRYGRYMFDDERITWSVDGGGRFFHRHSHRFSVTNVSGWMTVDPKFFRVKYLYYALTVQWEGQQFDYTRKAHPSVIREVYELAIPPLEQQDEVIEALDKFDALVNDLSIGLPAELAARRKQYEYYRDKLLTFEEAAA